MRVTSSRTGKDLQPRDDTWTRHYQRVVIQISAAETPNTTTFGEFHNHRVQSLSHVSCGCVTCTSHQETKETAWSTH
jgi:hypothetical protein